MDIEVRCNPIQDTLREISSQSKSHSSEMETFTALHGATSSPSTGGRFCGDDSALVPRGYCPQWPYFLQGVSSWLSRRFETTEMTSDINHAIRIGQKAVSLTAQGHLTRAIRLDSLGISLCLRFQHKGSMEDLDAAIKLGQEVLDCFRNHPIDPGFLNNLALRLGLRS
ncbi:TPR domain-containing protein [Colletotrichum plurivorum]|uniref:TPR domain-containing protein n=1 Tax=Colletotrichum plurivorum TaxID=2175906 RepID=A0A8H6KUJ1_9PEZI|nr:TPR domain-containing protein [Colletotrichum plurivorum]